MFTKTLNCGHCGNLVDFEFREVRDYRELPADELDALHRRFGGGKPVIGSSSLSSEVVRLKGQNANAASMCQCPRCNHPTMIIFETTYEMLNGLMFIDEVKPSLGMKLSQCVVRAQYPEVEAVEADPVWPAKVRETFVEAQKMHRQGIMPAIVLTTCGTVLELALKELNPDDQKSSLAKRIDKLHEAGVITSPIRDWAHDIRLDRNSAVHEGEGNRENADEYIAFLTMFFNMVFSLPNRIEQNRLSTRQ